MPQTSSLINLLYKFTALFTIRIDPPFGSPAVGEEEMSWRKARQSLTNHQFKDAEEDPGIEPAAELHQIVLRLRRRRSPYFRKCLFNGGKNEKWYYESGKHDLNRGSGCENGGENDGDNGGEITGSEND
ncbi:hypothetical protein YC2023_002371 [Brassica napus]